MPYLNLREHTKQTPSSTTTTTTTEMTSVLESVRVPTYLPTYLLHHPLPSALNIPKAAKEFWRFLLDGWVDGCTFWLDSC
jgi:hypothetical protein